MGARGRASKDELLVVRPDFAKARPPAELNAAEKKIWERTVSSEPSEFFATAATRDVLALYCSAMSEANRLTATLREFKTEWLKTGDGIKTYKLISERQSKQVETAIKCARSLRLTNQSRYRADAAGSRTKKQAQLMPWEFDGPPEEN